MESTGFFCIVMVLIIIVASIVSYNMIKKQKGVFSQLMSSGEAEEQKGNDHVAIAIYKHALSVILGLEKGSAELTAKGIGLLMEEDGKKAIEKIDNLYTKNSIQYSWDDFNALVAEFAKMSSNKELVDNYGLPKGSGKELFSMLTDKLRQCINSLPEINTQTSIPAPVVPQSSAVSQSAIASTPASTFIPSADEYAAKNAASKKRKRIILWSIIAALILCVCLLTALPLLSN